MSRTYRRKNQQYEYIWVLKDWGLFFKESLSARHDRHSLAGRKAIPKFHSDAQATMNPSAPSWCRKVFDRPRHTRNNRMMRLWLKYLDFDPVFESGHRHDANWTGW